MELMVEVHFRLKDRETEVLEFSEEQSISEMKEVIEEICDLPEGQQSLLLNGVVLEPAKMIGVYMKASMPVDKRTVDVLSIFVSTKACEDDASSEMVYRTESGLKRLFGVTDPMMDYCREMMAALFYAQNASRNSSSSDCPSLESAHALIMQLNDDLGKMAIPLKLEPYQLRLKIPPHVTDTGVHAKALQLLLHDYAGVKKMHSELIHRHCSTSTSSTAGSLACRDTLLSLSTTMAFASAVEAHLSLFVMSLIHETESLPKESSNNKTTASIASTPPAAAVAKIPVPSEDVPKTNEKNPPAGGTTTAVENTLREMPEHVRLRWLEWTGTSQVFAKQVIKEALQPPFSNSYSSGDVNGNAQTAASLPIKRMINSRWSRVLNRLNITHAGLAEPPTSLVEGYVYAVVCDVARQAAKHPDLEIMGKRFPDMQALLHMVADNRHTTTN